MDTSRLLLLIFVVMSPSDCLEIAEPQCEDYDGGTFYLPESEAFHFVHYAVSTENLMKEEFKWYKNKTEEISFDEKERIHFHGGAIFFLNLHQEDSGLYTAWHIDQSGECSNFNVIIEVFKAVDHKDPTFLYGEIRNSDENKQLKCPDPVKETCEMFGGTFSWYKDFSLIQGDQDHLWVKHATQDHEGIYTCICTWPHNHKLYNSSGSRKLIVNEPAIYYEDVEILSPTNKENFADESFMIKLNCTVLCGVNLKKDCHASWNVNGVPFDQMNGYNQTTKLVIERPSQITIATAVLTIEKLSAKDFQTEFTCIGRGIYTTYEATLILKRRGSLIPLAITATCVLLFCVFAAVLVKCFAIDLALVFRPYFPLRSHNKGVKLYDAYVVYQRQGMDRISEDTLCRFVTHILPTVLEEKCGYRLFIHGRDDIPGEDRVELVEDSMKQSRRLMVILPPGSGAGCEPGLITDKCSTCLQISGIEEFDWQVGLYHALVQTDMSVILVQLGNTGPQGYTHLPMGLQHLIRKSAPLRWPEGSRHAAVWNSHFWKRVRYLMPATPSKRGPQSAII